MFVALLLALVQNPATTVVRCSVNGDSHARVYELQRSGEGDRARWVMTLRSREAGTTPVILPLPDARPLVTDREVALEYRTLNGGRNVKWKVDAAGAAALDVYTNFELEVNVDANLDPRVELMNTEGTITNLSCAVAPKP
jgi:hypothetical protein